MKKADIVLHIWAADISFTSCTSRNSQSTALDSLRPNTLTPRLMN